MQVPPQSKITKIVDDRLFRSSTTEILSSLQFEKKVKSRSYSSEFTLNDEVIVSVDRREQYLPIEDKVTIEVDISLGFCDSKVSDDGRYVVRLHDMGTQNAWVFRMINYDTFVDKDISQSIKEDAMEPNKLYLVKHKHTTKTEDKLSFGDSFDSGAVRKRKLRTTSSQFNPSDCGLKKDYFNNEDNISLQKKDVLRNELLVFTGEKQCHFVKDRSFTSYIDIDLSKGTKHSSINIPTHASLDSVNPYGPENIIQIKEQELPTLSLTIDKETLLLDETDNINDKNVNEGSLPEEVNNGFLPDVTINEKEVPQSINEIEQVTVNRENIPFAEDTEDEDADKVKGVTPLSKYLQYYLPTFKSNEEELERSGTHSDVSTCIESSTEIDSMDGYMEETLMLERRNIVSLDEFNNFTDKDEPAGKDNFDEADSKGRKVDGQPLSIKCDNTINFEDIICQENMVLYVDANNSLDTLNLDTLQVRKDSLRLPNTNDTEQQVKMVSKGVDEDFVPVSVRRLQYEMFTNPCGQLHTSMKSKQNKINLITSDNYTNLVEVERLFKAEISISENKENENDKESSISYSSGSMIVKDIASDENNEYFKSHNNIDELSTQKSIDEETEDKCTCLVEVEEESENDNFINSIKTSSSRKTAEVPEAESEPSLSESEIDATSASSFTTSVKIENIAVTMLLKTPIDCSPGKFEKFVEERERKLSERFISSLPASLASRSISSSISHTSDTESIGENIDEQGVQQFPESASRHIQSPLTNISNTSSVSSSVLSSTDEFADTQTLIRDTRKEVNNEENKETHLKSSQNTSLNNSSEEKEGKYIVNKTFSKDPNEGSTENESEESYSETSSSSRSDQDDEEQFSVKPYSLLIQDEEGPHESNMKIHDNLTENVEDSSGTEDSSSSSSDYVNISNKFTLRQGESIEHIEELMLQPQSNYKSLAFIPLRKQKSVPNLSYENGKRLLTSKSVDHREKLDFRENPQHLERPKPAADLGNIAYRNSSSSSHTLSSSSDEESNNLPPLSADRREEIENGVNNERIDIRKNVNKLKTKSLSSMSDSLSSSSEEESNNLPQLSTDRREEIEDEFKNERIDINIYKLKSKSLSPKSDSLSSSSDEESNNLLNLSTDRREEIEDDINNEKVDIRHKVNKVKTENLSSSSSSLSSTTDEELKKLELLSKYSPRIITEEEVPKSPKIANGKEDLPSTHSSSDSLTISSSTDEESLPNTSVHRKRSNENNNANGTIETQLRINSDKYSPRSSILSSNTDSNTSEIVPKNEKGKKTKDQRSFSSSSTLSTSSDEESENLQTKKTDNLEEMGSSNGRNSLKNNAKEHGVVSSSTSSYSSSSSDYEESGTVKRMPHDRNDIVLNGCVDEKVESTTYKEGTKESLPIPSSSRSSSLIHLTNKGSKLEPQYIGKVSNNEDAKRSPPRSSISSSHSKPYNERGSADHIERLGNLDNNRIIQIKETHERKETSSRSSSSSDTLSSSTDEDSRTHKSRSIDHREKFKEPNDIEAIEIKRNAANINSNVRKVSSSTNTSLSSSDNKECEIVPNASSDDVNNADNIEDECRGVNQSSTDSDTLSSSSDEGIRNNDSNNMEPFKINHRSPVIDYQRRKKSVDSSHITGSSSSSDSLSSSSDEDLDASRHRSIDHREKFENLEEIKKIEFQRRNSSGAPSVSHHNTESNSDNPESEKIQGENEDSALRSPRADETKVKKESESSDSLNSSSDEEVGSLPNQNIDHREEFQKTNNGVTQRGRTVPNAEEDKKGGYSSESHTSSSMSDEEMPLVVGHEKSEIPLELNETRVNDKEGHTQASPLSSIPSPRIPGSKEANSRSNRSIDRLEKFDTPVKNATIKGVRKKDDEVNSTSRRSYSQSESTSLSSDDESSKPVSTKEIIPTRDIQNEAQERKGLNNENVASKTVEIQNQSLNDKQDTSSQYSSSTISEESLILNKEEEKMEDRRYQTLPITRLLSNMPLKEKSKSLDKPVMVEEDYINTLNKSSSSINMIEKRYSECTETWSRQSPVENRNIPSNSKPQQRKKHAKIQSETPSKRAKGPLTTRPRPIPSYLSPINAFPYVPSDPEYYSNDSIVNDYSSDSHADEIKTRHGSLPDFIRELSSNKIVNAEPPRRPQTSRVPAKVKSKPKMVDLNYGDEDIYVNTPKSKVDRRTSNTSITTDGSYLDYPVMSSKPIKSSLAKLDSFSSASLPPSKAQVQKPNKYDIQDRLGSKSTSSTISTSISSRLSNSKPQTSLKIPKPNLINKPLNNQIYKEKSQMINDSNIYPVQSKNPHRQKIPSTSESSEYSSTSDEGLSSTKEL